MLLSMSESCKCIFVMYTLIPLRQNIPKVNQFPFILRTIAAIWIRFSHASFPQGSELLSNISIICLQVRDTLAKVRLNPDSGLVLGCSFHQKQCLKMSRYPIRLLVR